MFIIITRLDFPFLSLLFSNPYPSHFRAPWEWVQKAKSESETSQPPQDTTQQNGQAPSPQILITFSRQFHLLDLYWTPKTTLGGEKPDNHLDAISR
jgi:hypothetical protein